MDKTTKNNETITNSNNSTVSENKKINPEVFSSSGDFDRLPLDLILYLLSFCSVKDLARVVCCSKKMNYFASHDRVWKTLFARIADVNKGTQLLKQEKILTWKQLYKTLRRWKWSIDSKAPEIEVSSDGTIASRPIKSGRNPAIMTSEPLTKVNNWFRVEIIHLGNWLGIGVGDSSFLLSGSNTLGTQPKTINSSYFWQVTGIKKLQMWGETSTDGVSELNTGDIIDVQVDFDANMIFYYNNEALQGVMVCTKHKLVEGQLWPTVNLSYGSEIVLKNYDQPKFSSTYNWKWGTTASKKASVLEVSVDGLTVKRKTAKGMNPAIMAMYPLTKRQPQYRVLVKKMSRWIGIGICDHSFRLNDSKTLGTQPKGVNSAYFYQTTGITRLQMYGEKGKDDVKPISPGDIIDIKIDFDLNRIYYFHNEYLQGFIAPQKHVLKEGTIYPSVDMAVNTTIVLLNNNPVMDLNRKWKALLSQLPTSWKWSTDEEKKSPSITISHDRITARREKTGENSAVLATQPLTKNSWYFVVEIKKLGDWIGIGVADRNFKVEGSKVLGVQEGINSSYFFQSSIKIQQRLKLSGEQDKSDVHPIEVGDYIGVEVDFKNNKIDYYNNDLFQGSVSSSNFTFEEGELYPCLGLSIGTEVSFVNEIS